MGTKPFCGYGTSVPCKPSTKPMVFMLDGTFFVPFSFETVDTSHWTGRIILSRLLFRLSGHHPILSFGCLARIHPILYLFALGAF